MHLGADKIRVQHVKGWSKELSGRLSIPLGVDSSVQAEASSVSKSGRELLYEATLRGNSNPVLPNDLAWFPYEPAWQSIANGRIEFGLKNFNLNISYEDDFGINAGLKILVQKSGLDIGGKFEDHQSTVWSISGEFTDL